MQHSQKSHRNPRHKQGFTPLEVVQMHVEKFDALYTTDDICLEELASRFLNACSITCRNCNSTDIDRRFGQRFGKCRQCGKKLYITAGTFFNKIRHARPWLLAIWLIENGVEFNAFHLQQVTEVAYSTAWTILKKISIVIHAYLESFQNAFEVPTAELMRMYRKRSIRTPAIEHPCAEQAAMELECSAAGTNNGGGTNSHSFTHPSQQPFACSYTMTEEEKKVLELISDVPAHFDDLVRRVDSFLKETDLALVLLNLELEYLVEKNGSSYSLIEPSSVHRLHAGAAKSGRWAAMKRTKKQQTKLAKFVCFVSELCRGIARKYVGLYSAFHWCRTDKKQWPQFSLLTACALSSAVTGDDIRRFVSPLEIKIAL